MIGQRVRDKISDQTGVVKGTFWNSAIVLWDEPDEDGNYVSSVSLTDLQDENGPGAVAKHDTESATETPTNKKESAMTNSIKTPKTVRELGDLASASGVTPSVYLMRTMTPEGWRWVETDSDGGYYEGPESEAVDSEGRTLPLALPFDPEDGRAVITLGDPGSPFDMDPESARTLANQLLEAADRLERDLPALIPNAALDYSGHVGGGL